MGDSRASTATTHQESLIFFNHGLPPLAQMPPFFVLPASDHRVCLERVQHAATGRGDFIASGRGSLPGTTPHADSGASALRSRRTCAGRRPMPHRRAGALPALPRDLGWR